MPQAQPGDPRALVARILDLHAPAAEGLCPLCRESAPCLTAAIAAAALTVDATASTRGPQVLAEALRRVERTFGAAHDDAEPLLQRLHGMALISALRMSGSDSPVMRLQVGLARDGWTDPLWALTLDEISTVFLCVAEESADHREFTSGLVADIDHDWTVARLAARWRFDGSARIRSISAPLPEEAAARIDVLRLLVDATYLAVGRRYDDVVDFDLRGIDEP
ncbi:MAG: hypothetical protein ACKORC_08650 [Acidimicrobiia bacterium]